MFSLFSRWVNASWKRFCFQAQTNLYPDDISGFEVGFWVNSSAQPANSFTAAAVTDKFFNGTRSVKFDCPDAALPTDGNANAILGASTLIFRSGTLRLQPEPTYLRRRFLLKVQHLPE